MRATFASCTSSFRDATRADTDAEKSVPCAAADELKRRMAARGVAGGILALELLSALLFGPAECAAPSRLLEFKALVYHAGFNESQISGCHNGVKKGHPGARLCPQHAHPRRVLPGKDAHS